MIDKNDKRGKSRQKYEVLILKTTSLANFDIWCFEPIRVWILKTTFDATVQKLRCVQICKMADQIVGKRVLCEGFTGEIKYVGLVPPTSGKHLAYLHPYFYPLCWR